jgi:hypothetical protein
MSESGSVDANSWMVVPSTTMTNEESCVSERTLLSALRWYRIGPGSRLAGMTEWKCSV